MTTTDLAANIKRGREACGISQEEAARRIGEMSSKTISVQTWRRWENGETNIPSQWLPWIAKVLLTTPAALWEPATT